jgi:outer membrane protein assembly factor BamE (lipoprotein component of BamABCDE complex)
VRRAAGLAIVARRTPHAARRLLCHRNAGAPGSCCNVEKQGNPSTACPRRTGRPDRDTQLPERLNMNAHRFPADRGENRPAHSASASSPRHSSRSSTRFRLTGLSGLRLALLCAPLLSACAVFAPVQLDAGMSEQEVVAKLGRPTNVFPDGPGRILEYRHGPAGQTTDMARFGADGRLVVYEQVLTMESFYKLKPGVSTRDDVFRTIGSPSEVRRFSRVPYDAWHYPYKENRAWDSRMTLYMSDQGVLQKMENGPDPSREPRDSSGRDN